MNSPRVESGVIFLFECFCLYNSGMMNDNYNTPNSGCCGRSFPTAPENKCNYNDCCMSEYSYKQKACIRNKQPDCESQAVIPSITVETVDGITNLANCLVHVTSTNTTYYVDDKHRILITWAGPVNIPGYDMEGNPNHYKNQIVTDTESEMAVIYDNHGVGFVFGITAGNLQEAISNKLDEMAEDGTLERLIEEAYQGYFNLIFPNYGAEGEDTLGDCTILQNGDESLMIDTFTNVESSCYEKIKEALSHAGISTLTYLVITHYHGDHIGNVINLLNGGYLDGCTVYLPRVADSYPSLNGNNIKTALENAGVTWIEINNQSFTVGDDLNVQMRNGSAADYQYYENLAQSDPSYNNSYNDRSIICDVEYKGRHLLFTGDLEHHGCEYNAPKLSSSSYDFLKDCHHGYINNAPDFCAKVNPDYVVIPASIGMVNKNYQTWMVNSAYWVRKSKNVAIQGYQDTEMVFRIDTLGVHCDGIYFVNNLSCDGATRYYVDANTTSFIRTGSKLHPFKTLAEAAVFLQKDTPEEIIITVNSLITNNSRIHLTGWTHLTIEFAAGLELDNDVLIDNCTSVLIKNLNITSGEVLVYRSNVILENYTNTGGARCLYGFMSRIMLRGALNLSIDTDHAIVTQQGSEIDLSTSAEAMVLTYSDNTDKRLFNCSYTDIKFGASAVSYLKDFPFDTKIMQRGTLGTCTMTTNANDLLALYKDNTGTYSGGDLEEDINKYNVVTVIYRDNSDYAKSVRVDRWHKSSLEIVRSNPSSTETYIETADLSFNGTTFSLSNNTKTTIKSNGTVQVEGGNFIKVVEIYGEGGWY